MSGTEFPTAYLDPRLAAHALRPMPVWLWNAEASRILWANPTGAAIFNADTPGAVSAIEFATDNAAAMQIARLSGTLPQGGAARLERLRGFGAKVGGTLTCLCSRLALADNSHAVLVVATERAGRDIALADRARRLLADFECPAAVFTADGELIEAQPAARERLGAARDLIALGAEKLAREASRNGEAEGKIAAGRIALRRLGAGATVTLLITFLDQPVTAPAPAAPTVATADQRSLPRPSDIVQPAAPAASRRSTLRFVWQMDLANRFTMETDQFARLVGPKAAAFLGRPWAEIASELKLDPKGEVSSALALRDTWSGIVVSWPVDGATGRLPVEMSGLPVFDRDRQFAGYRGFGVCRDLDRLPTHTTRPVAEAISAQMAGALGATANVLPFPAAKPAEPALNSKEQSAFQELGRELTDRLSKSQGNDVPAQMDDDFGPEPVAKAPAPEPPKAPRSTAKDSQDGRPILDRLPIGILVYRLDHLVYTNRAFLDWTGYPTLDALSEAGGLDSLFIETKAGAPSGGKNGGKALMISTLHGQQLPVEGRLQHHLERRERPGIDAQHAALCCFCRCRQQGHSSGAAPRRRRQPAAARHSRYRHRRRAGARSQRPHTFRQPQRRSAVRPCGQRLRHAHLRRTVCAGEPRSGPRLSRTPGAGNRAGVAQRGP
jgi:PAS domain-containing protein